MSIFDLFDKIATPQTGPVEYIIAGLGNPGAKYENTRHNAGFMAIDAIAEKNGIDVRSAKFSALVGDGTVGGHRVLLMKPQTFMNLSGDAVLAAAKFYKIDPKNVVVLCDDVSFDIGVMRIRRRGTHGGHNGLRDICTKLSSIEYCRVRIGVGKKPHPDYDLADFVLGKMSGSELDGLRSSCARAAEAVELIVRGELDNAMSRYNG